MPRQILGHLFRDTDYPVNIRDKFRFEWRYVILDIPNEASVLPPEIYEREKEKFKVPHGGDTRDGFAGSA